MFEDWFAPGLGFASGHHAFQITNPTNPDTNLQVSLWTWQKRARAQVFTPLLRPGMFHRENGEITHYVSREQENVKTHCSCTDY